MWYPTYLVHFNKNHSSKDGRFTSGDGDGDGIVNDHHNYAKNKEAEDKKTSGGGGAINLDEDDTGEDEKNEEEEKSKGVTSKYTLKELMKRQNEKSKKKKKSKAKAGKKKKKKIKVESNKISAVIGSASDMKVPSDDDSMANASDVERLLDNNNDEELSLLTRLLGK